MAIIDLVTKETFNISIKWVINQGLAIAVMCVIIYFDRQEKAEMKASINLLNTELKTYLKTDRDTLLYVLKDVNETLKPYKNGKIR
jgi:hypothetical protein